jgi:hypothetical protein
VKKILHLLASSCLLFSAGCFSLETPPLGDASGHSIQLYGNKEQSSEHVVVSNFGWYFFNRWPIVCGNAHVDRSLPWRFFRNDVDENVLQRRLMDYASARGCNVTDLQIFNNAEVLMSIGVGGVALPLPYVISYRELQYSCSLVRWKRLPADAREAGKKDMQSLKEEMRQLLNRIPDGGSK